MNTVSSQDDFRAPLRQALWCGTIPLIAGALTVLAWQFYDSDFLIAIGFLIIMVGLFLFLVGMFAVWDYQKRARQESEVPHKSIWRNTLLTSGLLLFNFPAALLCIFLTLSTPSHYVVVITNESAQTLSRIELVSGSETILMAPIQPGESDSCDFRNIVEWDLVLNAMHGDVVVEETIDEYTTNMRTTNRVTVRPDGSIHSELLF